MSDRTDSKSSSSELPVKGCAEYRLAMELTVLRRRLQTEALDLEASSAVRQRVLEIEKALGV